MNQYKSNEYNSASRLQRSRGIGHKMNAIDGEGTRVVALREREIRPLPVEALARPTGAGPVDISIYPGYLVALEGTDGVGRSTQIALLREWLETQGFGVLHTGLTRRPTRGRRSPQGQAGDDPRTAHA